MTTRTDVFRCAKCDERLDPQDHVLCPECSDGMLLEQNVELREALEAVLLFHSPPPWEEAKRARWQELTGKDEATTKVLCDRIREVLADEEQGQ